MLNLEKGHHGEQPFLALTVIINITSNGGTRISVSSGNIRMKMMVGRITAAPMTSEISEKMLWVVKE